MKHSVLALAALAISPFSYAVAQQTPVTAVAPLPAPAPVNLALNKKYVSSDTNVSNWDGGLTDGSWDTTRGHTYATGNAATFPKTVTVDLETPQSLGYVAIGVPPFGSTKTVKVSLSADNTTFTQVGSYTFTLRKEEKQIFTFAPMMARYIKLTYTENYTEQADYPPITTSPPRLRLMRPVSRPYCRRRIRPCRFSPPMLPRLNSTAMAPSTPVF